jgi:hypothetical protein
MKPLGCNTTPGTELDSSFFPPDDPVTVVPGENGHPS